MSRVLYELCGFDEELRFSPFCWRARFAVAHKGLETEVRPWRFIEKEALAFSGQGQVPVLVDGDEVVHDSYEIMRYLDRTYPERPLLGSPDAEARARFFKHYAERSLAPGILRAIIMDLFNALDSGDRDYFRETREKRFGCTLEELQSSDQGLAQLDQALAPLRARLEESEFVDGEAPGAADYLLIGNFMWARSVSDVELVAEDDPVYAWRERMLDLFDGLGRNAKRAPEIAAA